MIGIGGPSCSGKTTLAKSVAARLTPDSEVISIDEYFIGLDKAKALGPPYYCSNGVRTNPTPTFSYLRSFEE